MKCMEALFSGLSGNHAVDIALVRESRLRRSIVEDAAVMLSFSALYALFAFWVAGAILHRAELFICGLVIMWTCAGLRYIRLNREMYR
jgi:hypothetical protein